jgi:hypothetical protein
MSRVCQGRWAALLWVACSVFTGCNERQPEAARPSPPASAVPVKNAAEALLERVENEPALACEIGYEQTKEAMKTPPVIDAGGFPPFEMAPKHVYMADCLRMPRTVQKCVVFEYAFAHNAECEWARAEYGAEIQRRFAPGSADSGAVSKSR